MKRKLNIAFNEIDDDRLLPVSRLQLMLQSGYESLDCKHDSADAVYAPQIEGWQCYISKNSFGGWLAYIDVTSHKELHTSELDIIDETLPFHGGCTFAQYVTHIGNTKFDDRHFFIGCDWCHNAYWNIGQTISSFDNKTLYGVEDVGFDDVKRNLEEVIEMLPEFILKMNIRGNNANG